MTSAQPRVVRAALAKRVGPPTGRGAGPAGPERLLAEQGPHGYVLADVPQELEHADADGPLPIVDQYGRLVVGSQVPVEPQERPELPGAGLHVVGDGPAVGERVAQVAAVPVAIRCVRRLTLLY